MSSKITQLDLFEDDLDIIEDSDTDDTLSLGSIPQRKPHLSRPKRSRKKPKSKLQMFLDKIASGQKRSKNPLGYDKKLDDYFYLHPKEVEYRIINVSLAFAVFFSIYAMIMLCILCFLRLSAKDPIVILPEIKNDTQISRGRPTMHLALIYEDGSMYDQYLPYIVQTLSPNSSNAPIRSKYKTLSMKPAKFLFKLPNDYSNIYFGYSLLDTIYVMSGSLKKPITKYSGMSHRVISKSALAGDRHEQSMFMKGVQVGDFFWTWGQSLSFNSAPFEFSIGSLAGCHSGYGLANYCRKTHIWYTKRQKWSTGPRLPFYLRRPWDAIGINRTSVIIIGREREPKNVYSHKPWLPITLYYDFERPGWLEYPVFDLYLTLNQSMNTAIESISLAKVMEKKTAKVYACVTLKEYRPDLLDHLAYISVQSYDLSNQQYGQWKILQTYQVPRFQRKHPTIYSFKGELFFTDPLQGINGNMIQKSILDDTNEDPKYLVSVIPYIGYE